MKSEVFQPGDLVKRKKKRPNKPINLGIFIEYFVFDSDGPTVRLPSKLSPKKRWAPDCRIYWFDEPEGFKFGIATSQSSCISLGWSTDIEKVYEVS